MKRMLSIAVVLLLAASCQLVKVFSDGAAELFRGEVVAKAGEHKLYRSQLESYIPAGLPPADSAKLAVQYINAWAEDLLLVDMAEDQLSPMEKDVSKELEEYRRTLLKYRYEQRYINERLDTLITPHEIAEYYHAHPEQFLLERPVLKARYLIVPAGSKSLPALRRRLSSDDEREVMELDSLAVTSALKYGNSSDVWMDAITLAQEAGMDYRLLSGRSKNSFVDWTDENGILHTAYITDIVPEGKVAPLDYSTSRIRDLILSGRKHKLESTLEKDILADARKNKKFVIY